MNRPFAFPGGGWLLGLLLVGLILSAFPGAAACAPVADQPVVAALSPSSLFAGLLQDVVGNRTRLIQMSFIFILVGIFILWKK